MCWSRARRSASRVGRSVTFSATGRPASDSWWARNTRANAPRPSSPTSLKPRKVSPTRGPRRAWGRSSASLQTDSSVQVADRRRCDRERTGRRVAVARRRTGMRRVGGPSKSAVAGPEPGHASVFARARAATQLGSMCGIAVVENTGTAGAASRDHPEPCEGERSSIRGDKAANGPAEAHRLVPSRAGFGVQIFGRKNSATGPSLRAEKRPFFTPRLNCGRSKVYSIRWQPAKFTRGHESRNGSRLALRVERARSLARTHSGAGSESIYTANDASQCSPA